ncbi:hypothetical protein NW762_003664 [Fusarium torreyae]|uniref:Uncharacterized protein n=1 Tax=Fusarium torreyae TaxID=1237075 RepID=A0A9W8SAG8_9HYPO|nr:hypothetical protein NW762_003664 [Fusarium torreyae]
MAGEAIAKATDGQNMLEERILGADEAVVLHAPQPKTQVSPTFDVRRPGLPALCGPKVSYPETQKK